MMKKLLIVVVFALSLSAAAQLPLGSVGNVQPTLCPTGFVTGAACSTATVSCPDEPDIQITFGTYGKPTNGTVILLNGNGGTVPAGSGVASAYKKAGLSLIQFVFATFWEYGNGNLKQAACRPATVFNHFYNPDVPYAAQVTSAGSGAMGYALAWYGMAHEFKNVELLVGPVFSNIKLGCEVPEASAITIIPTDGASFTDSPLYDNEYTFLTKIFGADCLPTTDTPPAHNTLWASQSIISAGAIVSYPTTRLAAWGCNNGLNPSSAQSYLFLSEVKTPWTFTAITDCDGAEGVESGKTPDGVVGLTAIEEDMISAMTPK